MLIDEGVTGVALSSPFAAFTLGLTRLPRHVDAPASRQEGLVALVPLAEPPGLGCRVSRNMPSVKTKYAVSEIMENVRLGKKVSYGGPYSLFNIYDVLVGKAPRSLFLLKKDIVMKHLFPNSPAQGKALLARVAESIRALSCIQHPAFIEIEGGVIDGPEHIGFITEQVISCCSSPLRRDSSFILSELLVLVDGIYHIHKQGRLYGDITPTSVVLTASNHLKFCSCSCLLPLGHGQDGCGEGKHSESKEPMVPSLVYVLPKEETEALPLWSAPEMRLQRSYCASSDQFMISLLALHMFGLKSLWGLDPLTDGPSHTPSYSIAIAWKNYIINPDRPEENDEVVRSYVDMLEPYSTLAKIKTEELLDSNDIIPKNIMPTQISSCLAKCLSPVMVQRPTISQLRNTLSTPQAKLSLLLSQGPYISDEERESFFSNPTTRIVANSIDDLYIKDIILPRMAECSSMTMCKTGNVASLYIYSLLTLLHKNNMQMIDIVFGEWSDEEMIDAREILMRLRGNISCIISASSSTELSDKCAPFCIKLIEVIPLLFKTVYEECGKQLLFWAMTNSSPKITAMTCRMLLKFNSWCEEKQDIMELIKLGNKGHHSSKKNDQRPKSIANEGTNFKHYSFISQLINDILLIILSEKFIPETLNPSEHIDAYNKYVRNRVILVGMYAKYASREDVILFLQNVLSSNEYYDSNTQQVLLWLLYKILPALDVKILLTTVIPFVTRLMQEFNDKGKFNALQRAFSLLKIMSEEVTRKINSIEQSHKDAIKNYDDDITPILKISTPCSSIVPKSNNPDLEVFVKAVGFPPVSNSRSSLNKSKTKPKAVLSKVTDTLKITNSNHKDEKDPTVQSINDLLSF